MAGPDRGSLRRVIAASALSVAAIQTGCATVAMARSRRDYADAVWGPGLAAVAISSAITGRGDPVRRWGLAAVVGGWAARLTHQMVRRLRRSDREDPRYTEFLDGDGVLTVIGKVFVTQAVSQLFVSAPVQLAAASRLPRDARRWLPTAGLLVMVLGASTEAIADRQKRRYAQMDDDEKPEILDTGLWSWSRHPNYFGDSVVWDGAWLAGATSWIGAATLPAPILMNYLLMFATGAARTERRMQDRPGFRAYQQRVAFFFPRPPRGRIRPDSEPATDKDDGR